MIEDNFNLYYTQMITQMQQLYPEIRGGTVYKDSPPSFPYIYFHQIDGSTVAQTLSFTEEAINLGIQIDVYTEKLIDTRKISNYIRSTMFDLGFQCVYFAPAENSEDTSIYRIVSRYEKIET